MNAVLEMPMVAVKASVMDDVRDAVGDLNTKVAVLTTQHGYMIEAINRIELAVTNQSATSEEYRKGLMIEVLRTTDSVKAVDFEVEQVKSDVDRLRADLVKLTGQTAAEWVRKNAAVAVSIMVALSMFVGVVRWFFLHYIK
jgi:seryl-tRNA synthetase